LGRERELEHDLQVYRAYEQAEDRLLDRGAHIERVVLDHTHIAVLEVAFAWTIRIVFPRPLDHACDAYQTVIHEELESPLHSATIGELESHFGLRRQAARGEPMHPLTQSFLRKGNEVFAAPRFLDAALAMNTWEHKYVGPLMHDRTIGAPELCCRLGEMLLIQNKRVDRDTHTIGIPGQTTKDKENRRIPFDPKGRLAAVLSRRGKLGPNAFAFGTENGQYVGNFTRPGSPCC
jgi:hypothetical protein